MLLKIGTLSFIGLIPGTITVAHAQDPDSTIVSKAEKAVVAGKCKEAERILTPLLARNPPAPLATAALARCAIYYDKRTEDGLGILAEGLRAQPNSSVLLRTRGNVYNELRMYDRAEEDLRLAVTHAGTEDERLKALNSRSWNLYTMRKFEDAFRIAQEAYALDSTSVGASNTLALASMELADTVSALAALRRNVELQPDNSAGWLNLGFVLAEAGQHTKALEAYAKADAKGSHSANLLNNIGYSLLQLGDRKGARQNIEASIRKDPYNAFAYRNLALLELRELSTDKACTALEKALSLGFTKTYGNEVIELRSAHCR